MNETKGKRDAERAARVHKTAECLGVSTRHVNKVLNMDYDDDEVVCTYMTLLEGENKLLAAVKKMIPFTDSGKYPRKKAANV